MDNNIEEKSITNTDGSKKILSIADFGDEAGKGAPTGNADEALIEYSKYSIDNDYLKEKYTHNIPEAKKEELLKNPKFINQLIDEEKKDHEKNIFVVGIRKDIKQKINKLLKNLPKKLGKRPRTTYYN